MEPIIISFLLEKLKLKGNSTSGFLKTYHPIPAFLIMQQWFVLLLSTGEVCRFSKQLQLAGKEENCICVRKKDTEKAMILKNKRVMYTRL